MSDISTSCPIGAELLANSNVINKWFYSKDVEWDPWNTWVKKVPKDLYSGYNNRYTIAERLAPVELLTQQVAGPNGSQSSCDPPATAMNWPGLTAKTLLMDQGMLYTPPLCLTDIRDSVNASQTLDHFVDATREQTAYTFYRQHQARFTAAVSNKVVVKLGNPQSDPTGTTTFPATPATGTLTLNRLKNAYTNLQLQGGDTFPWTKVNGDPVYLVLMSYEARENIIRQNEAERTDIRFGQPSMLLDPMGQQVQPYRDFNFQVLKYPARWNFVNGQYVEVLPFLPQGTGQTTVGVTSQINPDYLAATYEDAYLFNVMTYQMAVPQLPPVKWGKNQITFGPQDYMGDWVFRMLPSESCVNGVTYITNPLLNKIRGYANFEFGSVVPRPELGWVWRFRRCGFGNDSIACST